MQFAVCGLAVLLITGCAAVEQFSNGFTFQRAAMMNTEALDDAGEKLFEDKCLELIYGDGTHTIAIGLETSELAEKIVHKSFAKQHRVRQIRDRLRCRTAVYEVHPPYCVGDGRCYLLHRFSLHG